MNNNKKPLSKEEIEYIQSKKDLFIDNLFGYTEKFIYVYIRWKMPIRITRNEDDCYFENGYGLKSLKQYINNYWLVYPQDNCEGLKFTAKQFEKIDDALEYALDEYEKYLKNRIEYMKEYRKEILNK